VSELVVRGGTVIDGTGSPGVLADIAVDHGRITAIGLDLQGDPTLDAVGYLVAPGFIDIHTHYDGQVFWDPALTPSRFHGVTTVIGGNCAFSIAPTRAEHRTLVARTLENVEDMDVATLEAGIEWVDVVVFDPDTIGPGPIRRVTDFPTGSERLTGDAPTGVRHVLVNGVAIRADGVQDLTAGPGQLVSSAGRS
jgi:Amidohydrolase family